MKKAKLLEGRLGKLQSKATGSINVKREHSTSGNDDVSEI